MEIIIYGLIFIIGTLFGSFFTLAVYRIPLGEDILYKHSFCPNCNEKLRFKDLIPILSYVILGGKCRYCGKKIRIRYLLLEILSGVVFLLFAYSLKVNIYEINTNVIIYFLLYIIYIATLFIIAGIDKENIAIQKSVLAFGMLVSLAYMVYACISNTQVIYTYIIYLILTIFLLIADIAFLRKKLYQNYTIQVLMLNLYILAFSGATLFYFTVVFALLWMGIENLLIKIKERAKKKVVTINKVHNKIPIGFYLCTSNILLLILFNWVM